MRVTDGSPLDTLMPQKPRILMFGWEFPPFNSGGLGVACLGLTRALARRGADILFVLPKKVPVDPAYMRMLFADEASSITIINIDTLLSPYITEYLYSERRAGVDVPFYADDLYSEVLRYAKRARAVAQKENFDIIYAHDWLAFLAGKEAQDVSGKPFVAHIHATEYDRCGGDNINEKIAHIERLGLSCANHVIAVSNYTKEIVMRKYGISAEKISVVHNGIDAEDFVAPTAEAKTLQALKKNGTKIVLFVGRITYQKGLEYFLEAAQKALAYNDNIVFVIAGSGDMHTYIMEEVARRKLSNKVLFMGFVRGKELQEAYRMADLYIMPSVSEPFGITTLEAMLHNTPVIVSRQSGVAEVAHHVFKVDFWDTDEMANKIVAVVEHDALRNTMREQAYREVQGINWDTAANKCLHIFYQL